MRPSDLTEPLLWWRDNRRGEPTRLRFNWRYVFSTYRCLTRTVGGNWACPAKPILAGTDARSRRAAERHLLKESGHAD